MHSGSNYSFKEVVLWTRRDIYKILVIAAVPTACFKLLGWTWLAVPWMPIALLGTAVAFVVGFKNNASYDRLWEGRRIWGAIVNASRGFAILVKDYITNKHAAKPLSDAELQAIKEQFMNRHFAWLTALRFGLREKRTWEAIYKSHNAEYKDKWFSVAEHNNDLEAELGKYLSPAELQHIITKTNKAAQIVALQSEHLRKLQEQGYIDDFRHMELEKSLLEFYNQQGAAERIKNFPYPRQYATINLYFIRIFILMLPLGMLEEFDKMGNHLVWLAVPFTTLAGWVFTTMEKIGEASESPFEGSSNDVPITTMSRGIEIDLREIMNMGNVPPPIKPENNILT